jgi:membrane dipeptidase
MPHRLIDLHCDWLLQYALDTTVYDPTLYANVAGRLDQSEGYLLGASASVLACFRDAREWAGCKDPWRALGDLITRIEAEFSGRILMGPEDLARWNDAPHEELCWAVIGVEGFDFLVRTPNDLERLPPLFERGVRVFQAVYSADNQLAGSANETDPRGLLDLGRRFLETLVALPGPARPVLDLAHLNPKAMSDVLDWFEADAKRRESLFPMYSHGAIAHEGFNTSRALTVDNLRRLRALGGTVGISPAFYRSADEFRASIEIAAALPWLDSPGYEGIAIGTDFLGVDKNPAGLGNVEGIVKWLVETFDGLTASRLIDGNARRLLCRACGGA